MAFWLVTQFIVDRFESVIVVPSSIIAFNDEATALRHIMTPNRKRADASGRWTWAHSPSENPHEWSFSY